MKFGNYSEGEPESFDDRSYPVIPEGILALTPDVQQEKDWKAFNKMLIYRMTPIQLADLKARFNLVESARTLIDHQLMILAGRPERILTQRQMYFAVVTVIVTILLAIIGFWLKK